MKKILSGCMLFLATITYSHAQNTIGAYIRQAAESDAESFNIPLNAIECMDYDKYLNFADFKFIAILPTKDALQNFVDPVSIGTETRNCWDFIYDESRAKAQRIYADVYKGTFDGTNWVKDGDRIYQVKNQSISTLSTTMHDRMEFILKNCIITEPYQQNKKFYRTMGDSYVRIEDGGKTVAGPFQQNNSQTITAQSVNETDNGLCIVVPSLPSTSHNSVAATLALHPEFSDFLAIMKECGILNTKNEKDGWAASDYTNGNIFNIKTYGNIGAEDKPSSSASTYKTTYLLNNSTYTLYVPTNDAMEIAFIAGLPRMSALQAAEEADDAEGIDRKSPESRSGKIMEVWLNFVKYHLQDGSIFMDGGFESGSYKTAKHKMIENKSYSDSGEASSTGRYKLGQSYKLGVNVSSSSISVTDAMGNTRNVSTSDALHNLMANEYWFGSSYDGTGSKAMSTTANPYQYFIVNSSFVVIQGIDGPLFYDAPAQFSYTYYPLANE